MNIETLAPSTIGILPFLYAMADEEINTARFYTPSEVAEILKVSRDTVLRKFANRTGVIDLGSPENGRKRQYRTLRISKDALERFIVESHVA